MTPAPPAGTARRAMAAALTAILVLVVLGACDTTHTNSPHPPSPSAAECQPARSARCSPTRAPAPPPVISQKAAAAVLQTYTRVNNAANRTRSARLNDRAETGAIRAQTQAEYRTYPYWTTQQKQSLNAFTYLDPTYFIPRRSATDQRPWFAVLARFSTSRWRSFMIFTETGKAWKLAAETPISPDLTIPTVAMDADGYVRAVDSDTTALAMRPDALPIAVNDDYASGGLADGAIFVPNAVTDGQRQAFRDAQTFLRPAATSHLDPANDPFADVFAIGTTDGGALVIASSAHSQIDSVNEPTGVITLGPHAKERAWLRTSHVQHLTTTYTCLDTAAVPPNGKGKPVLLGSDCAPTHAS
ncbi:hypothetical protein SAMN05216251_1367 [Actinacidiphila alni]|uniref:DUF8094 domain-containing protein n=1 Tax=Actinacidiphila alni TaxID=380248 RepID=A0A1I2MN07_9ACTN|nr:hypothetical protein [Actinacidiphila alni]SFF90756.1 hypothetical protein SAMN05216251_1367 [Actinacidiphila alni]